MAVAPESGKVVAGFAREDLFTVVLEQFQTDTADYADYVLPATTQLEHWDIHTAYGHTDVLLNRPAIAPLGEARPNTRDVPRAGRAHGLRRALLRATTTRPCAAAPSASTSISSCCWRRASPRLPLPDAPFAEGRLPHALGPLRILQRAPRARRARTACPTTCPTTSRPAARRRYPLAMISPPARNFLNSSFVNVQQPARHRGRAAAGDPCGRCRGARHRRRRGGARVQRPRRIPLQGAEVSRRARPGVVHGLGIWWRKLGLDGTNVNQLTSQRLTDMGRGPVFYDCLVEVRPA